MKKTKSRKSNTKTKAAAGSGNGSNRLFEGARVKVLGGEYGNSTGVIVKMLRETADVRLSNARGQVFVFAQENLGLA